MCKILLLVGVEPAAFGRGDELRTALGDTWRVEAAANAARALALLGRLPVGAVVCRPRLTDGPGDQLLDTILQRHPGVHRFLLADLTDRKAVGRCLGTAHLFLAEPCDAGRLRAALDRIEKLDLLFAHEAARTLVGQMERLPSPPATYFQIVRELQSPTASVERLGGLLAQDPPAAAKLLQVANSAALGLPREVTDPADAVLCLGFETTKSLVLLAHTYSHFDRVQAGDFSVEGWCRHSLGTARAAQAIARAEGVEPEVASECYTAGLLHDLGSLLLAANRSDQFIHARRLARAERVPVWQAEQSVFGTTHAEVGAWLALMWGLPPGLVEAVALHHLPARLTRRQFSPLTAVHVANLFDHLQHQDKSDFLTPDAPYLAELGLNDRLEAWSEAAGVQSSLLRP
ncbi:MAG TPA: HDOD domain-containing protein [Methylomirabilota bacterium]|nr:HDOD domain-containing protein [Methylomirabilota bacterium]